VSLVPFNVLTNRDKGLIIISFFRQRRLRRSHPIGVTSTPLAYQAPNHYAGQGGGYYDNTPYDQGPQYEQTYAPPQAPPPKYGAGGLAQPGNVYQPPPK